MKFDLSTTAYMYTKAEQTRYAKLGFKFTEHGCIANKVEIEINSIEELLGLIMEFGQVVVDNGSIEIYDSYRE